MDSSYGRANLGRRFQNYQECDEDRVYPDMRFLVDLGKDLERVGSAKTLIQCPRCGAVVVPKPYVTSIGIGERIALGVLFHYVDVHTAYRTECRETRKFHRRQWEKGEWSLAHEIKDCELNIVEVFCAFEREAFTMIQEDFKLGHAEGTP